MKPEIDSLPTLVMFLRARLDEDEKSRGHPMTPREFFRYLVNNQGLMVSLMLSALLLEIALGITAGLQQR